MTDPCGNIYKMPVPMIVERAAMRIAESPFPRAVSIEPNGMVVVESTKHASGVGLVGVYTADVPFKSLKADLFRDIAEGLAARVETGR